MTMARLASPHSLYFKYLCDLVHVESLPGHMYFSLCSVLYNRAYSVVIKRDNNRERDGLALRRKFEEETGVSLGGFDRKWCSFLEFLVGLSYRMVDEVYDEDGVYDAEYWFYEIIGNLGLRGFDDTHFRDTDHFRISDVIERVNTRDISYNGTGGMFPLINPCEDQRYLEVAKQMNQYIFENYKHK